MVGNIWKLCRGAGIKCMQFYMGLVKSGRNIGGVLYRVYDISANQEGVIFNILLDNIWKRQQ